MRMCHFWAQNGLFAPNKKFFGKDYKYHFHLPIGPFHCATFKKNSYSGFRVMRMPYFWAPNGLFAQTRIFSENPFISLAPFFHFYWHAKNQRQIFMY